MMVRGERGWETLLLSHMRDTHGKNKRMERSTTAFSPSGGKGPQKQPTSDVIDSVIDDDVHGLLVLVLGNLGLGDLLGHGGGGDPTDLSRFLFGTYGCSGERERVCVCRG